MSSARAIVAWVLVSLSVSPLVARSAFAEEARPGRATPEMPCRPWSSEQRFVLDLHQVSLGKVARIVSCATEARLIFAPARLAEERVTVVSVRPIDRRGLRGLWRALLAERGLVIERHGAYQRVQPAGR